MKNIYIRNFIQNVIAHIGLAWPATAFLCFLCSSRCGVGESMLRGVEMLSKDFFDFPIASLPLVDFSCTYKRGIYCFYFFPSFRSFTQRLTSFDPKFLPSIRKSPALEKKSGLVILSSEMEQKVSKGGLRFKFSINAQFKFAHFLEHTLKSEFSSARQILPQRPGLCGAGVWRVWRGGGRA